jgi:pyridoxine 5-phosphate synthase
LKPRLNVNIDHVATVREARRTIEPSLEQAARVCESAGADGITVHIRGDRRHIQDADLPKLKNVISTYLNVELAVTEEMLTIAESLRPDAVSLVPENPGEVTTEGGLDVRKHLDSVASAAVRLKNAGILVSIFIDPDEDQIRAAKESGADQIEICTARYAHMTLGQERDEFMRISEVCDEVSRISDSVKLAESLGLKVAAGHGLTTSNVGVLAEMPEIEEFNIGHHIISRAIFVGLDGAVREMLDAINTTIQS